MKAPRQVRVSPLLPGEQELRGWGKFSSFDNSQLLKTPGKNAPPDVLGADQYFWLPLQAVIADAGFNSHDTLILQESAQSIQGIQVVLEDHRQWRSESLVASVVLAYPDGKGKGKPVWFGWAFPPGVHELAIRPSQYTQLSLYFQQVFRRDQSLALYEVCRQFATSPGHRTPERSVRDWFHQLSGKPTTTEPPEYKYWKRDELKPAIAEINALSDIRIDAIEKKEGRRVASLHFTTRLREQESLSFPPPPLIDASLREPIMALGLSQRDADELIREHDATQLRAATEAMRARLRNSKLPKVSSPRAFLKTLLRNGVSVVEPVPSRGRLERASTVDPAIALRDSFNAHRIKQARALLEELDLGERERIFNEYLPTLAGGPLTGLIRRAGPLSPTAAGFHAWFAERTWGPGTDADLLRFASERLALGDSAVESPMASSRS